MPSNEQRRQAAKRKLDRQLERRAQRAKRRRVIGIVSAVGGTVLVVGLIFWISTMPSSSTEPAAQPSTPLQSPTELAKPAARPAALPPTANCEYKPSEGDKKSAKEVKAPQGANIPATGSTKLTLNSSVGDLPLTLDRSLAPCTVNNFLSLADQGYFNDSVCHRLTTSAGLQVLQCGDPTATGTGGPGYAFADEVFEGLKYGRSYLAMANSGPNTNGSQFFIVYGNAELPPNYTVFGSISEDGLKRVDEVARAGTEEGAEDGKPKKEVKITKAVLTAA